MRVVSPHIGRRLHLIAIVEFALAATLEHRTYMYQHNANCAPRFVSGKIQCTVHY